MGPIEGLWFTLAGVFIFLAVIRGFLKELGLTTVMIVWLFAMDLIIPRLEEYIRAPDSLLGRIGVTEATRDTPLWLIFTLITVVVIFIAYEGETLAFEGTPPKGAQGIILGFLIGAVNGYLVCGTLWWILNRYNYPIRSLGFFVDFNPAAAQVLSPTADRIVNQLGLLPPDLLGQGVETAGLSILLSMLVVAMILLRVVR